MKQKIRSQKGITLIALVVTIIILLILAGVALNIVAGENGILRRATNAVDRHNEASAKEQAELLIAAYQTEWYEARYVNNNYAGSQKEYIFDKLKDGAYTDDYFVQMNEEYLYVTDKSGNLVNVGILQEDSTMKWSETAQGIIILYSLKPNTYTNKEITLTINAFSQNGSIMNIEAPSNIGKNEDGTYTITQNGEYTFTAIDSTGESKTETIKVSKIDKLEPEEFTPVIGDLKSTSFKIIANVNDKQATNENAESGIARYKYYVNDVEYTSEENTYTVTGLNQNTKYTVYAIAYDRAGNEKRSQNTSCQTKVGSAPVLTLNGVQEPEDGFSSIALDMFDKDITTGWKIHQRSISYRILCG